MMESRDYLEMAFKVAEMFANDGQLTANELSELLSIAERDGKIDNNEIRVLTNVISKIQSHELSAEMLEKMKEVQSKINLKK